MPETYEPGGDDWSWADEDDDWEDPEECPGCDTPLAECPYPDAGCCPDCNHAANYDRVRTPPADVEIRRQSNG